MLFRSPELGSKHPFDTHDSAVCTAYGRDRGEHDVEAKTYENVEAWLLGNGQEYDYLFRPANSSWEVRGGFDGGHFRPLADALLEEEND